jgi:ArsR family transcriptional regulator, arsenate/arsenite/antimonite-responsive transcriptional repressor / arsenate reductase (thioredoxin)
MGPVRVQHLGVHISFRCGPSRFDVWSIEAHAISKPTREPIRINQSGLIYRGKAPSLHPVRSENPASTPPPFLQLAAHPLRWRILNELAGSDQRVRELTSAIAEPQNLVSYHLGRLRSGGLVAVRKSSADGRDSYYSVNLDRCADLMIATGAALHPGLQLVPIDAGSTRSSRAVPRVLFLCTGNSARSQMAEALLEHRAPFPVRAFSAGSRPKPLHVNAIRVMRSRGIDISGRRSKHVREFSRRRFDYVVTLCDRLREECPEFDGHPKITHWSMPDPSASGADDAQTYPAFERAADEIDRRIHFLLALIEQASSKESSRA